MSVSSRAVGEHTVVDVAGEVDVYSAPTLRDRLSDLLDAGQRNLVVDLSGVGFLDSTGIGVLVASQNRARDLGASLGLVCTQDRILKLFQITGLQDAFSIYPSLDAAVAAEQSANP